MGNGWQSSLTYTSTIDPVASIPGGQVNSGSISKELFPQRGLIVS